MAETILVYIGQFNFFLVHRHFFVNGKNSLHSLWRRKAAFDIPFSYTHGNGQIIFFHLKFWQSLGLQDVVSICQKGQELRILLWKWYNCGY